MQRRVDTGAVIRRVFEIYVDQASVLMPAAAVVFVFTGIIAALLIAASSALSLVALIIDLVATTLFTGMVVELVADVQDGRRDASPGQLLRAVTPVLGQLILVGVLAGIGIVIGFVLIIVPGLILITIWSVAAPVVVLEHPGVFAALRRCREVARRLRTRAVRPSCRESKTRWRRCHPLPRPRRLTARAARSRGRTRRGRRAGR